MVEVFRTDVNNPVNALALVEEIHKMFPHYRVNFDLGDCDRILRVQCESGKVSISMLIALLNDFGFHAEVLQEEDHL